MSKLHHGGITKKAAASRLSGKLDQVPGFIYTAELTVSDLIPREVTGGFKILTGYPDSYFLKPNYYDDSIVSGSDSAVLRKFRNAAKPRLSSQAIPYTITTRDGKRIKVHERVRLLEDGARKVIGGIVELAERVSDPGASRPSADEVMKFEEIQRLNKHLLEVNQLKDEFLANTSHELRTPLNSIIGFLTLITEGYYEGPDELRLFTRNALESSYHLLNVINDLLDISKIESGKMQLQIERVYVNELMDEIYMLFKVQTDQKGLKLDIDLKGTPLFAAADVRKLKQVLINIMGNAVKFTTAGGIRINVEGHGAHIRFAVKDTGIGIPGDKQDKLFQKFIQVDGSATRRYGGSGLGLVISKHLVEMMGGQISARSEGPGLGTTVTFTIPKWTKGDN